MQVIAAGRRAAAAERAVVRVGDVSRRLRAQRRDQSALPADRRQRRLRQSRPAAPDEADGVLHQHRARRARRRGGAGGSACTPDGWPAPPWTSSPSSRCGPTIRCSAARNCIITPHIAWASLAARRRLMAQTVRNVAAFLVRPADQRGQLKQRAAKSGRAWYCGFMMQALLVVLWRPCSRSWRGRSRGASSTNCRTSTWHRPARRHSIWSSPTTASTARRRRSCRRRT